MKIEFYLRRLAVTRDELVVKHSLRTFSILENLVTSMLEYQETQYYGPNKRRQKKYLAKRKKANG